MCVQPCLATAAVISRVPNWMQPKHPPQTEQVEINSNDRTLQTVTRKKLVIPTTWMKFANKAKTVECLCSLRLSIDGNRDGDRNSEIGLLMHDSMHLSQPMEIYVTKTEL